MLRHNNRNHKKYSKFQIVTMIAVWAMIIFMILGVVLPPTVQIIQQYF